MKLHHKLKYGITICISTLILLIGFQNCAKTLNTEQTDQASKASPVNDVSLDSTNVSAFGNPSKLMAKTNGLGSGIETLALCFTSDLTGDTKTCSFKMNVPGVGAGKAVLVKSKVNHLNSKCILDLPDTNKEYSIAFQIPYKVNVLSDEFSFEVLNESVNQFGNLSVRGCSNAAPGQIIYKAQLPLQMYPYVDVKKQFISLKEGKIEYNFDIDIPSTYDTAQSIDLFYMCRRPLGMQNEKLLKTIKAPFPKVLQHTGSDHDPSCLWVEIYYIGNWPGFTYQTTHNPGKVETISSLASRVVTLTPGQCNDGFKTQTCPNTVSVAPPPPAVNPPKSCTYYSQRVNVEISGKSSHCTSPGNLQLWEKSSCEYNSRGCGLGTCQCSTTGEIQNGVCVLTNKQKDLVSSFGSAWSTLLTTPSAAEIKAPSTNSCQPVTQPPNNPTPPPPPPSAPEACHVYEFSDVVEVTSDYANVHCEGWNGTGLSGAQSTGKVFCEYNSRGCGVGTCQCYNKLQGVKLSNGTCSVQQKGSRGTKSSVNRCLQPEQDFR